MLKTSVEKDGGRGAKRERNGNEINGKGKKGKEQAKAKKKKPYEKKIEKGGGGK